MKSSKQKFRNTTSIIIENVHPDARIITDSWRGYLKLEEEGFDADMINHMENFVDPDDPTIHTLNIENRWRWLKSFLYSKGSNRKTHLNAYLCEYIYRKRFNNSFSILLDSISRYYSLN